MIGRIINEMIVILIGCTLLSEIELCGWTATEESKEPHRQTYLEYVKERLEVERLMR